MVRTVSPWHLREDRERECIFIMADESPDVFPVARIDLNEGRYLEISRANAKQIVMWANTFDDFWNLAANMANFLKQPIALSGDTIVVLHYLNSMANGVLEKAKEYER